MPLSTISLKLAAIVFYLQYIAVLVSCATSTSTSGNTFSSSMKNSMSSGYQPTSGIEERWVAEEEFHGASNQQQHHKKKTSQYQKVKDPQAIHPGNENIEESWWDDDDE